MKHFEPFPLGHFKVDWKYFGERVKVVREENGWTQRDLAKLTEISAATICRCEKGLSIEPENFFLLLQVLGLPFQLPDEILKRV